MTRCDCGGDRDARAADHDGRYMVKGLCRALGIAVGKVVEPVRYVQSGLLLERHGWDMKLEGGASMQMRGVARLLEKGRGGRFGLTPRRESTPSMRPKKAC